jgi:hypothetical protein
MAWTNIANANLDIGAPIRSVDILALRDNVSAVPNGDTGAPKIKAEALNGGQSGTAPIFAARAWVNFDGTGTFSPNPSTSKIRGSGNVSSVQKNSTGNYTVNFTTNMPSEDYCTTVSARRPSEAAGAISNIFTGGTYSTSAVQVRSSTFGAGAVDVNIFNVSVFI